MTKKIRLNKDDVQRLFTWLQKKDYNVLELLEEEGGGIGSTVTAFITDQDGEEGRFKVITSFQDW